MEAALKVLNEMKVAGVVADYAIGGAMAAMFYAEPVVTEDLDAFILLPEQPGAVALLTGCYDFLKNRGATEQREYLIVEGVPVQLLVVYDELTAEAMKDANAVLFHGIETRVMRAEHLIAISLKTGRAKDRIRVALLDEEALLDRGFLMSIIQRHGLDGRWNSWRKDGNES